MSDLIVNLLKNRGVNTDNKVEVDRFLSPDWDKHTHDPFLMKDMMKAIERVKKAIETNEKIVIYTDYDCDGIPGGVVLHDFLRSVGAQFTNYIPHRHKEGYGIHKKAIDFFIKEGVSLMITADLGITNIEEVKYAQSRGLDVIVTDHHLTVKDKDGKDTLPDAFAVLNTKRQDCNYPEKMLCGCATAWKMAHAFLVKYRKEYGVSEGLEKWWLDMVGLSTVADMVPLTGENRVLAIYGLRVLRKSKRQGLLRLMLNAKIKQSEMDEVDIGFGIAPRINAASRMAEPMDAFRALLSNAEATHYAEMLESYNKDRKAETTAAKKLWSGLDFSKDDVIICGNKSWSAGILGLIASGIVESTKKTVFVWGAEEGGVLKGSVRSGADGADVVKIMKKCEDVFVNFGGHEAAGGFALKGNDIKNFEVKIREGYASIKDTSMRPTEKAKEELTVSDTNVNEDLYAEIRKLAPFGQSNPCPIVKIVLSQELRNIKMFGAGGIHFQAQARNLNCVKFFANDGFAQEIKNAIHIKGHIEKDSYRNSIMLKIL